LELEPCLLVADQLEEELFVDEVMDRESESDRAARLALEEQPAISSLGR
jgi:hypothetical protein